jgi:GTP pyrophosphokinase
MVPIDHTLKNGNIVEIVTSSNSKGPSIDWLKIAQSSNARNKIRGWLKKESRSDNTEKGKEMLEKYAKRKGYESQQILKSQYINKCAKAFNLASSDDLYTAIGSGGVILSKVVTILLGYYHDEKQSELRRKEKAEQAEEGKKKVKKKEQTGVTVKGVDNLLIRFSKCCNPVPGDEIIGFITKGRGISVHRKDCINVQSLPEDEKQRFIDVEWDMAVSASFQVEIYVEAMDRLRLLQDVTAALAEQGVNILASSSTTHRDGIVEMRYLFEIGDLSRLDSVLREVRETDGVFEARRMQPGEATQRKHKGH